MEGWMNIYKSGFWHPARGMNRHGADLFHMRHEAIAAIDPASHYVATVRVEWQEPGTVVRNLDKGEAHVG